MRAEADERMGPGRYAGRLALIAALLAVLAWPGPHLSGAASGDAGSVCIVGPSARLHRFRVEVADTPQSRATGLMHRTSLAADAGMLFLHEGAERLRMWMKNTLVSLDMLFIDEGGRVLRVAARTVPMSERIVDSERPAVAVLEILGGRAEALGIRAGDRVLHPRFGAGCP